MPFLLVKQRGTADKTTMFNPMRKRWACGALAAFAVLTGCQTPQRHAVQQRLDKLQAENSALRAKAETDAAQAHIDAAQQQQDAVRLVEQLGHRIDELTQRIDNLKTVPQTVAVSPAPAAPAPAPAAAPSEDIEQVKAHAREELARMQEQLAKAQIQAEAAAKAAEVAAQPHREGERVPSWKGKTLPLTKFIDSSENRVDLSAYIGHQCVVLTIMKGFYSGGICIYCTAQAAGLAREADAFRAADAEVLVMYPGAAEHVPDFVRSVQAYEKSDDPRFKLPFKVLLDVDMNMVASLGIKSDLSLPATYVLDRQGIVQYEYIGRTISDRPTAEAILEEVKRIGAAKP